MKYSFLERHIFQFNSNSLFLLSKKQKKEQNIMLTKPRESKVGSALYEQVVARNFQTIENFLSKFHQIFLKQDQFQSMLGKIEHRINLMQKINKKTDQTLCKSIDIYDKKMNSLKEFILEKIKNPMPKTQHTIETVNPVVDSTFEAMISKQFLNQYEKQSHQSKKFEQTVSQHIKKLQYQVTNLNQRINSLTMLTSNIDEKIGASNLKTNSLSEQDKFLLIKDIQIKLGNQIEEINRNLHNNISLFNGQMNILGSKTRENISNFNQKLKQFQEILQTKVSQNDFEEYKQLCAQNEQTLMLEIAQAFANKKQTKKSLNLLQKKIYKLQLIQQMVIDPNENRQNMFLGTNLNILNRTTTNSIHSSKKSKPKLVQLRTNQSMVIRKLSKQNLLKQRF